MSADVDPHKFMVDHMLGSLARWLRMLGYDCEYKKDLSDDEIMKVAEKEDRIILTRDRHLADRGKGFWIRSTSLDEQLCDMRENFELLFKANHIRCSKCNGILKTVEREQLTDAVPLKSLERASEFWKCERCGKHYWDGTHWEGILARFKRLGFMEENHR